MDRKPGPAAYVEPRIAEREALRFLSARYEAILAAIPDIITEVDTRKVITWTNEAGFAFFGNDVIGKEAGEFFVGEQTTYETVQPMFAGQQDVVYVESWQRRHDGQPRLLAWWCRVLKDERGRVTGALSTARDISERYEAREALRASQERLLELQRREQQRVEAELERVRQQLVRQTQLATIGQVSASIAHELRNPLGTARNAVYLLKRKLPPEHSQWHEYLDLLDGELAAANRIINELVAMSQGRAPERRPVALEEIVSAARQRVAPSPQIAWHFACEPAPLVVEADAEQMELVFRNLLSNAVHAMGPAGEIRLAATRAAEYDEIFVCDSGPGIPAEIRDRVFEPLFTTKRSGTGLGLTVSRQIVERHGGTIECVDSAQGACFRIRLPRDGA